MNKHFISATAAAAISAASILTACGHNVIQYGNGIGVDFGINPENCSISMNLRKGDILSAVTRDVTSIEFDGATEGNTASGESAAGSVSNAGKLKVTIGRQINGAAADLVKAGADPDRVTAIIAGDPFNTADTETDQKLDSDDSDPLKKNEK